MLMPRIVVLISACLGFAVALTGPVNVVHADEAEVRRQAQELAPLLTYYGTLIGPPDRQFYSKDAGEYRRSAERLSSKAETAELREAAAGALAIIKKLDTLEKLRVEFVRDFPGPPLTFWPTVDAILEGSARGNHRKSETVIEGWDRYGNIRSSVREHDGTMTKLLVGGFMAHLDDLENQQRHREAVIKHRLAVGKQIKLLADEISQVRRSSADHLAGAFAKIAGAAKTQPLLEFKVGQDAPDGSPIEAWLREKKAAADWEIRSQEKHPVGTPTPIEIYSPFFRVINTTGTLHHVALTLDFHHYQQPGQPIMRQTFFIPDWPMGAEFSVSDAFQLNLENRTAAGLHDDVLGRRGAFGQSVFPGYAGIVKVRYSLLSDELRQENVEVELTANRAKVRDAMLANAENLAARLVASMASTGEWARLPTAERQALTKFGADTVTSFAASALANAPADWAEAPRAKILLKDYRGVSQRLQSLQQATLAACRRGLIYTGTVEGRMANAVIYGRYDLEFTGTNPSAGKIEATLTHIIGTGQSDGRQTQYRGKLVRHPRQLGYEVQLAAVGNDATGKTTAVTKADRPTLVLAWNGDSFESNPVFRLSGEREIVAETANAGPAGPGKAASARKPMSKKLGDPRIPIGTVWEGTRKILDPQGKTISEETIVVTIRDSGMPATGGGSTGMVCDIEWDGTQTSTGGPVLIRAGSVGLRERGDVVTLRPGFGRAGDRFRSEIQGTLLKGSIEGARQAPFGKPGETEITKLMLKKK